MAYVQLRILLFAASFLTGLREKEAANKCAA